MANQRMLVMVLAVVVAAPAQGQCALEWSALGDGTTGDVSALTVFDDGAGCDLYVGGFFFMAGSIEANGIARWDGQAWTSVGTGVDNTVFALTVFDDGSGPALYASGFFTSAGGVNANSIAKWDGQTWAPLGSGMSNGEVLALEVFDDGSGPALYAAGTFTRAGGRTASRIARWDGSAWSAVGGGGMNNAVYALRVFDDGSGPALYAGGSFTNAGGASASRIAKLQGGSWSALSTGMNSLVTSLMVFDDGGGPDLYAGGGFHTAGGVPASGIVRWDGVDFSPLGDGVNGDVNAMAVFDDGAGPSLFAGGFFTTAGAKGATNIARWSGTTWSALDVGTSGDVYALQGFDEGSTTALYTAGFFASAGEVTANNIARWGCPELSGAVLTDVTRTLGLHLSGGVPELISSDDQYYVLQSGPGFDPTEPHPARADFGFDTGGFPASALDITIEEKANIGGPTAVVLLRNWNTAQWDEHDRFGLSPVDQTFQTPGVPAADYISGANRIEVRVRTFAVLILNPTIRGIFSHDFVGVGMRE